MTHAEAKALLQVYQPHSPDAEDARFKEALRMTKEDPQLAEWYAEEQAFNFAIGRSLKATPVPANLKLAIVAGGKVLQHFAWWRLVSWPRVAAVAAVALVGAGFFWFSLNRTESIVMASRDAIEMAQARSGHLVMRTNDLAKVREYLSKCHAPSDFTVPVSLRKLPVAGCTLVGVRAQTAAVICFRLVGNHTLSLFVMDQIEDDTIPTREGARLVQQGDWAMAIWSDKGRTYMLSGKVHPDSLRRLII